VQSGLKIQRFLLPEQIKLGLAVLMFRDQFLLLLDGVLGTRRGELAVRWQDCALKTTPFRFNIPTTGDAEAFWKARKRKPPPNHSVCIQPWSSAWTNTCRRQRRRNAQARLVEAILAAHLLPGKTAEAVAP